MIATLPNIVAEKMPQTNKKATRNLLILNLVNQNMSLTPPPSILLGQPIFVSQKTCSDVYEALKTVFEAKEKPLAIIADYTLLRQYNFLFSQKVRQFEALQHIPIIAIAKADEWVDVQNAMKSGVDDCYNTTIRWDMLEKRIEFLRKFRPQLQQAAHAVDHINIYEREKIPFGKRVFDIVVASTGLVLVSPVMLLTAAMIKIESGGNVFYSQKRAGRNYQVFDFWKFRSMYADADQRILEMQKMNQYQENGDGPTFLKVKNDPRITKVGRIIRKYSIDELPQLVNILTGEMSIVGNRPLPLYEAQQLTKDNFAGRWAASAGLTGLWQVSKRGSDSMSAEERIALDVTYAQKSSVLFDLSIVFRTFTSFIQKENV
jgi:lipopolysaccharide/colanic/teichoic acid biosynthesis glycosyltransferase